MQQILASYKADRQVLSSAVLKKLNPKPAEKKAKKQIHITEPQKAQDLTAPGISRSRE